MLRLQMWVRQVSFSLLLGDFLCNSVKSVNHTEHHSDDFQKWCVTKWPQPDLSHLNSCCHGMCTDRILERVHLCEVIHVIIPQLLALHGLQRSHRKPQMHKSLDLRLLIINQSTCWQAVGWIWFYRWKRRRLFTSLACVFTLVWEFERYSDPEFNGENNRTCCTQSWFRAFTNLNLKLEK